MRVPRAEVLALLLSGVASEMPAQPSLPQPGECGKDEASITDAMPSAMRRA